jgi:hypothetical protein
MDKGETNFDQDVHDQSHIRNQHIELRRIRRFFGR